MEENLMTSTVSTASYRNPQPEASTFVERVHNYLETRPENKAVKFDAAFLERRMREFREAQRWQEEELVRGIVGEILDLEECDVAD
jgi:hypothetical protein